MRLLNPFSSARKMQSTLQHFAPFFQRVATTVVGPVGLVLGRVREAVSRSSLLKELTSLAQSLKLERNPWAVVALHANQHHQQRHVRQRSSFALPHEDALAAGFAVALRVAQDHQGRRASGTRCSTRAFILTNTIP